MANFNQTNQQVKNQVNADSIDSVNFSVEKNNADIIALLNSFLVEISKLVDDGNLERRIAVQVENHIQKTFTETQKPKVQKRTVLENLEGAKKLLEGIASATNLISILAQAAKIVGVLFV